MFVHQLAAIAGLTPLIITSIYQFTQGLDSRGKVPVLEHEVDDIRALFRGILSAAGSGDIGLSLL